MRAWYHGLTRMAGRRGCRWMLALLLIVVCMGLTGALFRITFLNNDDANIMYALAGYRSGAPYPTHRFINVALGLAVSSLYAALPAVPWWSVYQLAMLLLSMTVVGASVLKLGNRARLPLLAPIALLIVLYTGMFIYTVTWIAFTLTAGMLGTAACALVMALDWEGDDRRTRGLTAAGAMLLMVLCFFTRNSSGYSMLCFFSAAGLYQLLKAPRGMRRRVVAAAGATAVLVLLTVWLNRWGVVRYNPPEYPAFEAARGHFIDYPHATYDEDPAFFEDLGWDATVYALADNLCYIDPAVNAHSMEAAANRSAGGETSLPQRLANALAYGETYFRGSGVSQYLLVIPVLLFVCLSYAALRSRCGGVELAIGCAVAAGAFALCFYLCDAGRFPVRTFMLIAMPTATAEAMLLIRTWGIIKETRTNFAFDGERRIRIVSIIGYLGIAVMLAGVAWSLIMTQRTLRGYDKDARIAQNAAAEAYVMAHPENVYITDVTSIENLGAFTVYTEQKPVNLIDWGGTGMHSGWKDAQLAANGLDGLSAAMFQQDDVYFITERDGDKLAMLDAYLRAHAGGAGYTAVETVSGGDGLVAYRFQFADKEGDA